MIDWNTVTTTILASSSITAIVLVVVGFVAKSIFTQLLSRDIEKYKSTRETELERFKADLQKSSFEHQTRYLSLHSKRAEVIAELYMLLVHAEHKAISLANPVQLAGEPTQNEKRIEAYKSGKTLYEFFEQNRIYFKQDCCERVTSFINSLYTALSDFNIVIYSLENKESYKMGIEKWQLVWGKLTKELPPIKAEIENEFREILGLLS